MTKFDEKFVPKVLAEKESYILNASRNDGNQTNEFYQFEYKVQKSEAFKNLEMHEKGLIQIPKWITISSFFLMTFILSFFIASLVVLSSIKPEAYYMKSCADRPCASSLNLKCINKTCQCVSPQYYQKKCVDLSKYGEYCIFSSNCDPSQSLSCIGSKCVCTLTKYWDSSSSMCMDRLTFGDPCNGDQCRINVNLICNSIGSCGCVDDLSYYWSSTKAACLPKRTYLQSCSASNECLNSDQTICINNICKCVDTQYYDRITLKTCVDRVGEFDTTCTIDEMCLMPMYCNKTIGCTCSTNYFFDANQLNCVPQFNYNQGPCYSDHHCRQDLNLVCDTTNMVCICTPPKYTWSPSQNLCKITYAQGKCGTNDCNLSENLVCSTASTICSCPTIAPSSYCDCIRKVGDEKYWDPALNMCVPTVTYGNPCTANYTCQTKTQNTYCNPDNNTCDCAQPGGLMSYQKCGLCKTDETFFNDRCYFISTVKKNNKDSENACKARGNWLAVLSNIDKLLYLVDYTDSSENYWISGRKSKWFWNSWSWSPGSSRTGVSFADCSLSGGESCLSYNSGCFDNKENCNNLLYYICESLPKV